MDSWQLANLWRGSDAWNDASSEHSAAQHAPHAAPRAGHSGHSGCSNRCFAGCASSGAIGSIATRTASRTTAHCPLPHPASRHAALTPPRAPLSPHLSRPGAAARRARRPPRRTCTPEAIASLNSFARRFVADVTRPNGWLRAGNGAFVHSCCEHDALFKDRAWAEYASAVGGVPMREAVERWWRAPPSAPAAAHTHLPCALLAEPASRTHQCNPTCAAFERRGFSMMEAPPGLQQPELSEVRLVRQCRSHYVCRPEAVETEHVNNC